MLDLTSRLLRAYFVATDWHPYNSYLHLTSSSSSILLDFPIPTGLSFSISSCPSPIFYSTHRLRALPHLAGSLGYVFASTCRPLRLDAEGDDDSSTSFGATKDARLSDVLDRFRIINVPSTRQWQGHALAGTEKHGRRDYLLYGCVHAPTARLDALYTTRLSPNWNLILTACSFPPRAAPAYSPPHSGTATGEILMQMQGPTAPGATNLQMTLQQDTGRWFNEFSYSVDDALWGFRTMHHFGSSKLNNQQTLVASQSTNIPLLATPFRSNDDDSTGSSEAGGGLKGRFSAGAELFFSTEKKSAGLSTGLRFTTLSEDEGDESPVSAVAPASGENSAPSSDTFSTTSAVNPTAIPSQPPTTITATLNPMMGHLSAAYTSKVGKDIVACSRYDFNVYSYESQLTVGGECWLRSSAGENACSHATDVIEEHQCYQVRDVFSARPASLRTNASKESNAATAVSAPVDVLNLDQMQALRGASLRDQHHHASQRVEAPPNNFFTAKPSPQPLQQPLANRSAIQLPTSSHRHLPAPAAAPTTSQMQGVDDGVDDDATERSTSSSASAPPGLSSDIDARPDYDRIKTTSTIGLLKWSLSSSLLLSLLWQGRLRNCIVAVGIRADLSGRSGGTPSGRGAVTKTSGGVGSVIKGIGMDVVYWGGGDATADASSGIDGAQKSTSENAFHGDQRSEVSVCTENVRL